MADRVREALGPGGRLESRWPGYEPRPGQLIMADRVAQALARDDLDLIEAGTGTGKTLAYLLPALISGRKTVVSTGTKNLQEQIYFKDLPFIRDHLGGGFKAAYLKGRENYLCLYHFKAFERDPVLRSPGEAVFLDRFLGWAKETRSGDRAEMDDLPEAFLLWSDVSAGADRCLGRKCPDFKDCFLQKARRAAGAADLVVVNHHLFMADLAVRGGEFGEVIPDYEAVIFDEAHLLEDVATQHFGRSVSSHRFVRLARDMEAGLGRHEVLSPTLTRMLAGIKQGAELMARRFMADEGEIELWEGDHRDLAPLREHGQNLLRNLEALAETVAALGDVDEEVDHLGRRAEETAEDLEHILDARDRDFVYFAERRGRGLFLKASPVDVSGFLQERLFEQGKPLVFTSATLAAGRSFDYFKQRMGVWAEVEGIIVESPFDFENQALLYVPAHLPTPMDRGFPKALADEVERLLDQTRGRAFVLFTSYRNLNYVAEKIGRHLPWPCLVQGDAPRHTLLENFRNQTDSVLLATSSFWQGVDVPGETLSAVIIDKLPFPRPDRPLVKARSSKLKEEGRDPFREFFIPEAIITLKQGLGRLIRTQADRGVLAILDSRLVHRNYGPKFIKSLPPHRLTHDPADLGRFLNQ